MSVNNRYRTVFTLLTGTALISCGNGGSGGGDSGQASGSEPGKSAPMTLVVASDLPTCNGDNESQLVYVKSSASFHVCSASGWSIIDIKGEKGDAGAPGVAGPKGDQGARGAQGLGLSIAQIISCETGDNIGTDDWRRGGYSEITKFTDGSYFFQCSSAFVPPEDTFINTDSNTQFWPANSKGVLEGQIGCYPYYVTSYYNISANTVTLVNVEDTTSTQTVTCEEVYPGPQP